MEERFKNARKLCRFSTKIQATPFDAYSLAQTPWQRHYRIKHMSTISKRSGTPGSSHDAMQSFLDKASELLMVSSPAISSLLVANHAQASSVPRYHNCPRSQMRRCKACGTALVPGWSCKKMTSAALAACGPRTKRFKASQDGPGNTSPPLRIQYKCDQCDSKSSFGVPPAASRMSQAKAKQSQSRTNAESATISQTFTSGQQAVSYTHLTLPTKRIV